MPRSQHQQRLRQQMFSQFKPHKHQAPKLNRKPRKGDIVFAHTSGLMGRLIRMGERLRWKESASHWNHACVVSRVTKGVPYVIEATLKGVVESPLSKYDDYAVVRPPSCVDITKLVDFQKLQLSDHYGLLSILAIAIDLVDGNWMPELRKSGTWICSALTAEGLRVAGWFTPESNWGDIYTVTPAQLFQVLLG